MEPDALKEGDMNVIPNIITFIVQNNRIALILINSLEKKVK
jgi:hypothetical protein